VLTVLDLFSGIGGFTLGLERTGGFKTVAFCEIEAFPRKVLNKHWPDVPVYKDIRKLYRFASDMVECPEGCDEPFCELCGNHFFECDCIGCMEFEDDVGSIDVIVGGFPCQDISVAGHQSGIEAKRSGLWSEFARLIGEIRPRYAIVENVTALLAGDNGRWFQRILSDMAEIGYDCEWHCIPASELGAHHHRDRVWIICYPEHTGRDATKIRESINARGRSDTQGKEQASESQGSGNTDNVAESQGQRVQGQRSRGQQKPQTHEKPILSVRHCEGFRTPSWDAEPELGRVVDGLPNRTHRIKGLGNAVVPQIPELIGLAILERENEQIW